jgi:hypothetical protein
VTITNRSHHKSNGLPKRGFNSMREAQEQARSIEKRQGEAMDAYQCGECHLWHTGHADASGFAKHSNEVMMECKQKELGYVVKTTPSIPLIRTEPPSSPSNKFAESAAKLHKLSQVIAEKETGIGHKEAESKRLAELAMTLFNQAAEHENQAKILASEVHTLSGDVSAMKSEAQQVMQEMSRVFEGAA